MLEEALAALGLTKQATIGGFMGAVVSVLLKLIGSLNVWQAFTSVLGGTLFAGYATPLVLELMSLTEQTMGGISFLIGAFGLLITAAIVKEVVVKIPELMKAWIDRIRGGRGGSGRGDV